MNPNKQPEIFFDFSNQLRSPYSDEKLVNSDHIQKLQDNRLVQNRNRDLLGDEYWKKRSNNEASMGVWKRRKGRSVMYTDLTGRELIGKEAKEAADADEKIINGDIISDRQCLIANVQNENKNLFYNHDNNQISSSSNNSNNTNRNSNSNSNSNSSMDMTRLETWGLPQSTVELYQKGGVNGLYQWQVDCLLKGNGNCLKDDNPRNLLFTAPTSGGKTLVAEIMMLRTLAKQKRIGGIILFVVPFVAMAIEKANYFRKIWSTMHIGVRSFDGETSVITSDVDVVVATFEKANMILNELLNPEDSKDSELYLLMMVVDELHLIQDSYRGYMLEVLVTKALYFCPTVQIIGMTATLPNLLDIAEWMQAECYHTNDRPIKLPVRLLHQGYLHQYRVLKKGEKEEKENIVWHKVKSVVNTENNSLKKQEIDTESLVHMVKDTVKSGGNVLVFCARKRWCKSAAKTLASKLNIINSEIANGNDKHSKPINFDDNIVQKREYLLRNLRNTVFGLDEDLQITIPMGIAWHHSGLTMEEKKLIEAAYQDSTLRVLVATSTLSAGVNLPATRVIVRSLNMGQKLLPVSTFRQMCGRAGRTGIAVGNSDAIVMVNDQEFERGKQLITSPLPDLESSLKDDTDIQIVGLCKLLLDGIVTKHIRTLSKARELCRNTLFAFRNITTDDLQIDNAFDKAVEALIERKFISQQQADVVNDHDDGEFEMGLYSTALGCAAVKAGISASLSCEILSSLHIARQHLIVKTNYHLIYLCTPPSRISVQWNYFSSLCTQVLNEFPEIKPILEAVGVKEDEICSQNLSQQRRPFYQHIFASLVLYGLVMEKPLPKFSNLMELDRGAIQSLQSQASLHSIQLVAFCEHLNWDLLANALRPISKRIASCSDSGVTDDIRPLVTTLGQRLMPPFRAKIFFQQGFKTVHDLANSNLQSVTQILRYMIPHEQEPVHPTQSVGFFQSDTKKCNTYRFKSSSSFNQYHTNSQLSGRSIEENSNNSLEKLAKDIIQRAQIILNVTTHSRNGNSENRDERSR